MHDLPTPAYQPWERWPQESEQDWAWFRLYRDSAYPEGYHGGFRARDLTALSLTTGASINQLRGRLASYAWQDRARALDLHIERVRFESNMSQVQRVAYAHQRILDKTRPIVEAAMEEMAQRQLRGEHLSNRETILLAEWQIKNDRLLTGQSTENVSVQHSWNIDALSPEDLEALRPLVEKGYQAPQKVLAPDIEGKAK